MGDAERLQILRPLGVDRATFVARDAGAGGTSRLVVVERVTRLSPTPDERAQLLRRARALAALEHPKVVRVREVIERGEEVLVVSDFVDGEWLAELIALQSPRAPLEILLRVLLDVLEGLAALHALADVQEPPLPYVHGGLSPSAVLVADDGVGEIAHTCRVARVAANERYIAPEVRRGGAAVDVRTDIYSVAAMLRDVLVDAPAEKKWAEALTEVAWRGCLVESKDRWPSAVAMAGEVRRLVGSKLASSEEVGSFLRAHFGPHMRSRRAAFDVLDDAPAPPSSGEPVSQSEIEDLTATAPAIPSAVKPLPPPVPARARSLRAPSTAAAAAPVAPAPLPPPKVVVSHTPASPPASDSSGDLDDTAGTLIEPLARRSPGPPPVKAHPGVLLAPALDEAYRRQLPTVPPMDGPRSEPSSPKWLGVLVAVGMMATFGVGWWFGRQSLATPQAPQAACASALATDAVVPPPAPNPSPAPMSTAASTPVSTAISMPLPTLTTAPTSASAPSTPPASSSPWASTPIPLVTASSAPAAKPLRETPSPARASTPPNGPVAVANPAPPPSPAPPPPPKPAGSSYVPAEL